MVVAVIPTSLPADAAPVAPVALAELPVVALAGAVAVELPLDVLAELHPAAKTAASAIPRSEKERARKKRPGAKLALAFPRVTALSLAMVILHSEDSCPR
jgi:hypothetical protein